MAAPSPQPSSLSLCSPASLPAWGHLGRGETWAPPPAALGLSTWKTLWSWGLHVAMSRRGQETGQRPPSLGTRGLGLATPFSHVGGPHLPPHPTTCLNTGTADIHCPHKVACSRLRLCAGPTRSQPRGSPGEWPTSLGSWWQRSGSQCGPRPPSLAYRCGRGWRRGWGRLPGPAWAD